MDINKFLQSGAFKAILFIVAVLLLIVMVFQMGMMVGFRKANFSYKWGENYHRNFGGPAKGIVREMEMPGRDFIPGHGVFGQIIYFGGDTPTLTIKGQDGIERSVLVKDKCLIRKFRSDITLEDLQVSDNIVIIGTPSSTGQIEADFIRVLPPPSPQMQNQPTAISNSSTSSEYLSK